ncbi:MAG: hypothetical protein AAF478_10225 [Pseudomonadota bacterium]
MRRKSTSISRRQATNTRPAILLAEKLGFELNYAITINFTLAGFDEYTASKKFAAVRERFTRLARKKLKRTRIDSFKPAFLWVLENTGHVAAHWLVHIPPERLDEFREELNKWIVRVGGNIDDPNTIDIREAYNPHGYRKYMLKGIDPLFAPLYRIDHVPQGVIYGKRFGYSTSIGPSQSIKHGTKKRWKRPANTENPAWMNKDAA